MKNIFLIAILSIIVESQLFAVQDSTKLKEPSLGNILFKKSVSIYQTNLDSAIYYMESANSELKKEKDWEKYVECFSALSFFHHTNHNFDSFRYNAELALTEAEKYLEPNNLKFGDIFNNLNAIYSLNGNNKKGIDLLHRSLEIRKKNNENIFQLSFAYQNLGTAYSRLGDNKKALEYLTHSINLRVESDSVPLYDIHFADSYISMAAAHKLGGDHKNSIINYKKCLSILSHEKCQKNQHALNLKITSILQIAENLIILNKLNEAKLYLDKVFLLHDKGIEIRKPTSLYLRSLLHYRSENLTEALTHIKNANLVSHNNNNENSPPLLAKRYKLLGDIYQKQNNQDSAIHVYNKGLSYLGVSQENNFNNELDYNTILAKPEALQLIFEKSKCLKSKAQSLPSKDAWLSCFRSYVNTIRFIKEMRSGIETAESKNILASSSMKIYEEALNVAHTILEFDKDEEVLKHVFEIIESNKVLLLLESYNKQIALGDIGIPKEMISQEYDLKVDLAYYAKEISLQSKNENKDENIIKDLQYKYQLTNQRYDSLIYQLNKISPDFKQYKNQINPVDITLLKSNLKKNNEVILEYFYGRQYLFLLLIDKDNIEFIKLEKENLKDRIDSLRKELSLAASFESGNEGFKRFYENAHNLYLQLFAPILQYLDEGQTNITIIPDGYISSTPFDILVSGHESEIAPSYSSQYLNYLILDYNITFAYSSTLYVKDHNSQNKSNIENLITFAPSFDQGSDSQERKCECENVQLQNLSCNVKEAELVSTHFSGNLYTQTSANKSSFLSNAHKYQIIHIASHACVDQEDGMLNQIFFSDGGISNYELYNSKLNAELSVLSACNTGIGEVQNGEGVLNLAKGFLMAGSKSALMSLWAVNDCTTSALMELFYSNLEKGNTRNESMRKAKINFLTNASKLNAHPYYWGAFVHYGKNKPLKTAGPSTIYYWSLVFILFLGLIGFFFRNRIQSKY